MSNITGRRHAQNQAFAIVRALESRLQAAGLSVKALWQWVLDIHGVSSRSDLSDRQWVVLSARLFTAQHNSHMFDHLCDTIRKTVGTCRVYRSDTNGRRTKVYEGVITDDISDRCQKHADASGCDVELHNADGKNGLQMFNPIAYAYDSDAPPIAPVDKTTPARIFEVHTKGKATQYLEIRFPDTSRLREWCRQYVLAYEVDIVVTDRLAHYALMKFTFNKS